LSKPRRCGRVRHTTLTEGRNRGHVDRMGGDVPPDRTVDVVSVPDVPRGREGRDGRCRRRDPLDGGCGRQVRREVSEAHWRDPVAQGQRELLDLQRYVVEAAAAAERAAIPEQMD